MKFLTANFLTATVLSAALAAPVFASETYNTSVVTKPNQRWFFQRLVAQASEEGTLVSGRLTAVKRKGLPKGHVDVAAYSPDGQLLAEAATRYSPSILTRKKHRRGGLRFSVELPQQLPANSIVKLSFHESDAEPSAPLHVNNIAI